MSSDHREHRSRVKAEFLNIGMEHFPPHKALELLLYYCIPRKDTNELAHRLIERFGSFAGVFEAPYELLRQTEGMGTESATYIKALSAFVKRYMIDAYSAENVIKSFEDAKRYMQYRFLSDPVECVLLACVGAGDRVVYSGKIAKGTLEKVDVIPSEVVKTCLRCDAAKAVLAHNHPGGICNPSHKDLATTFVLYEELQRVDVELFDHIIVASDGVYSMKESGMFPETGA